MVGLWLTADLHIGHTNIIRYCRRPYRDAAEMDRSLVDLWNDTVDDGDTVWVLGDVALGTIVDSLAVIARLRGEKVLLSGNHDRCWPGHGARADGWSERYLEAGFADVRHGVALLDLGRHTVRACHFPVRGDTQPGDRYVEHRPHDDGGWLLHGHVHDVWRQQGRMVNVGIDAWGGALVADDTLISLLDEGPCDRASLPWPQPIPTAQP